VDALITRRAQVLDRRAVGGGDELAHGKVTLAHPRLEGAAQQRACAAPLVVGVHGGAGPALVDGGPADERAVVLDDEHVALELVRGLLQVVHDVLQ
jgi:hypothetical protein